MLKSFIIAIGFVMLASFARAQTAQNIIVYEYGTYTSGPEVAVGVSQQGLVRYQAGRVDLVEQTRTIVAQIGVKFGFRYRITGKPSGTAVPLTIVAKFPSPGVIAPNGSLPFTTDVHTVIATVGDQNFIIWSFERRSNLVPGIWTFEIWQGNKKLGEQKFNVILPPVS